MEALVAIVLELLLAVIYLAAGACASLAMAAVDLIGTLLGALITGASVTRSARKEPKTPAPQPVPAKPKAAARKRRRHLLLIPLGILGVASFLVNFLFFEVTTRWAMEKFAARAGFAVTFETAEGNLYFGRFSFRHLTVLREPAKRAGFDLRIAKAELDVNLLSLIFRPIRLESLDIQTVDGQITKPARPQRTSDDSGGDPEKTRQKQRFVIDRMELRDARLRVTGEDGTDSHVEVISALSEPLRSDMAVFDFFFRSTVDARVDGHRVRIVTERLEKGRRTSWDIDDFPMASVGGLVPPPPIRWFEGGVVSARMADEWSLEEADSAIDMDWNITLRGVTVGVPPEAGPVEKITATALAKVVNGRTDDVSFSYRLVLDEESFRDSVSLDAAGFWKAPVAGAAKSIAERNGAKADEVEQKIHGAASRLRSILQRKPPEEQ